jgi:hypothetical protein
VIRALNCGILWVSVNILSRYYSMLYLYRYSTVIVLFCIGTVIVLFCIGTVIVLFCIGTVKVLFCIGTVIVLFCIGTVIVLFRVQFGKNHACTSGFSDYQNCAFPKDECNLKSLKNSRVYVFSNSCNYFCWKLLYLIGYLCYCFIF